MPRHSNLISNAVLIRETVELLQRRGGVAPATEIAEFVFAMPTLGDEFAAAMVADLAAADPRLSLRDNATVALVSPNFEFRPLAETDFVVFDTETTGAKPPSSRMTEIGAYKISGGKIVGEFETLVNPQTKIPPFISSLTGITNSMVERAPLFSEIAPDLLDFIGDAVLVAHNAHFDMRFLNAEIHRVFHGYEVCNANLCTVRLSRKLLPNLENHRLHTVARHYQIEIKNRHRAAGDALATAQIFINFLEHLREHRITSVGAARRFKL